MSERANQITIVIINNTEFDLELDKDEVGMSFEEFRLKKFQLKSIDTCFRLLPARLLKALSRLL